MITYPKRSIYLDIVQYKKGDLGLMYFRTLIKDSIIYQYTYIALTETGVEIHKHCKFQE